MELLWVILRMAILVDPFYTSSIMLCASPPISPRNLKNLFWILFYLWMISTFMGSINCLIFSYSIKYSPNLGRISLIKIFFSIEKSDDLDIIKLLLISLISSQFSRAFEAYLAYLLSLYPIKKYFLKMHLRLAMLSN